MDLSAAFDTIDHEKLLHLLETSFGITGSALTWFKSYLSDRSQKVVIEGVESDPFVLIFGVPQGSVLGPILFTVYTTPLGKIIRSHGLCFHLYADDTQLYIAIKPTCNISVTEAIEKVESCVREIKLWMEMNMLKLNEGKTELLVITSNNRAASMSNVTIKLGESDIKPSSTIRNLGVIFDSTFNMNYHVSSICKNAFWQIHQIGHIRKYLDTSTTEILINTLVTSKFDYCNSLLCGISDKNIKRLQRVQNACARLVTKKRKYDHVSPILKDLHWLPIDKRIEFKILLLTYKCLNGLAPEYLSELLSSYTPNFNLRSGSEYKLNIPKTRLKTYGDRAFSSVSPAMWNRIPENIKRSPDVNSFKKQLKTYMFKCVYNN